jgi:hypothetical protein
MGDFLKKAKSLRADISDWVVHYTRNTNQNAKLNLESILSSGIIDKGKGICFTESPIIEFSKLFRLFEEYRTPMLCPYGVAVRKEWLFQKGGRPVIYLAKGEEDYLSEPIKHLYEQYDPEKPDFTWLREWRLKQPVLQLSPEDTLVILPSEDDAEGLAYHIEKDGEYEGPGEYTNYAYLVMRWHYITLDQVRKIPQGAQGDEIITGVLGEQELYKEEEHT